MTKFRLSNHSLAIETGHHKNVTKDRRFCPFCPKDVETELHFLLACPNYNTSRARMLEQVIAFKTSLQFYSIDQKFQYLVSHIGVCEIYEHTSRSFKIRYFLTTFPKNPIYLVIRLYLNLCGNIYLFISVLYLYIIIVCF